MKKTTGFEGGNIVPITVKGFGRSWPTMPNEQRQRDVRIYPTLNVGQHDNMMKNYLEGVYRQRREAARARIREGIAKRRERLANLTKGK